MVPGKIRICCWPFINVVMAKFEPLLHGVTFTIDQDGSENIVLGAYSAEKSLLDRKEHKNHDKYADVRPAYFFDRIGELNL